MADKELIQSDNSTTEVETPDVVENTTESNTEGTPDVVTTSQKDEKPIDSIDMNKAVTSSIEAHKVLKAQKELQSKPKASKSKSDNPVKELDYKKQYEEMLKLQGKQSKELSELRKFQEESKQMRQDWQKSKEQQEALAFQKLIQQNPMEAYREMARREAQALVSPVQSALTEVQAVNVNNQLMSELGDKYKEYTPVMERILTQFQEIDAFNAQNPDRTKHTKFANDLANDAKSLIALANQEFEKINKTKAVNISDSRKADNLRIVSGVAKKSNVKSETPDEFKNLSLQDMTQEMKRMGLLKK